jgi:GWxTD domain-containing protein
MILFLFFQIEYQAINRIYGDSAQELALYYKIPSRRLQYYAKDTSFLGEYEIQVTIFDKHDNQLTGDYWRKTAAEDTVDIQDSIKLYIPSNSDYYAFKIIDLHAGVIFTATEKLIQARNLGNVFWAISNDSLKFSFTVLNRQGIIDSTVATIGNLIQTKAVRRGVYNDSIIFDVAALPIEEHPLKLELYSEQGKIDELVIPIKVSRPFYLDEEMWSLRVDQLQYIATPREMDRLNKALEPERDSLWREFWGEFDPTPNTKYNEREAEYFERIAYAEKNFSDGDLGWRSDRARIFVKNGPPDEIQRYPYEIDSYPYVIWYYYQNNLRFVFVDRYGFGQYILANPAVLGL